ncbi:MAG: hypothetical protein NTX24_04215 [Candidatus Pacearchaeota archaeon]|nr:hypothetical protein [Candidatus Pacearchaeota archaeon]
MDEEKMDEEKICWCLEKKEGIRIIELKPHLSESYIKESEETFETLQSTKGKWRIILAYYACYNAFYSLLMKCGIRCEIHDCTLELMDLFDFNESEIEYLKTLKEDRKQNQYYLKNIELKDESAVGKFILSCKVKLNGLNSEKIEKIRHRLKKMK